MESRKIKVLLGFKLRSDKEDKETERKLVTQIKALGYEPNLFIRTSKRDVQQYLNQNRDCQHVVLMETIGQGTWSQNELADLVDERNLNMVIILTAARAKQIEYLTTLYAAGITSAIFEQGRGVPAEEVAELLIKQRSRKAAREYYRIDTKNISIRSITNEMYNGLVVKIMDKTYDTSIMGRLLKIAGSINPYQMSDFLKKLPKEIVDELTQYAEYGQLVEQLKESGIKVPYKRPKVYRHIDDDKPFNEGALEELSKRGLDYEAFKPKEPEQKKKAPFWKKVKTTEKVKKEETSDKEENKPTRKTQMDVIENISTFDEWEGSMADEWTEDTFMEAEEEENYNIDISTLKEIPKATEKKAANDAISESDDTDLFI